MKVFYVFLLLFLCHFATFAQIKTIPSSNEFKTEEENVAQLAKEKIKLFKYYVEQLTTNDNLSNTEKTGIIKKCKLLFKDSTCPIQTKNINSNARDIYVGDYLLRIANPPTGTDINITFDKNINIERVEHISGNQYLVYGKFAQYYERITGTEKYEDITLKVAVVQIVNMEDPNRPGYIKKDIDILGIYADKITYSHTEKN